MYLYLSSAPLRHDLILYLFTKSETNTHSLVAHVYYTSFVFLFLYFLWTTSCISFFSIVFTVYMVYMVILFIMIIVRWYWWWLFQVSYHFTGEYVLFLLLLYERQRGRRRQRQMKTQIKNFHWWPMVWESLIINSAIIVKHWKKWEKVEELYYDYSVFFNQ